MKKVLIITYYWPPAGGAGVQRWLKFVKYLDGCGFQPFVLTVDPGKASYPVTDASLGNEIPSGVQVFTTSTFEPFGIYKKMSGRKQIPYAGFAGENDSGILKKISRFIRGNFFIPDARKGWNVHALKKAHDIIREHGIDAVITTSPPHSTQLIGLELKRTTGLPWIADLRDPWTGIYYYPKLMHTALARRIDSNYERSVLQNSDAVIVVSDSMKHDFMPLHPDARTAERYHVIPNGYDEEDFAVSSVKESVFTIAYTGTLSSDYPLHAFVDAFRRFSEEVAESVTLHFVGAMPPAIRATMQSALGDLVTFTPHVEHAEAVRKMQVAHLLLLVVPDVPDNKGILTGKLFEYMGSRTPVLCVGPVDGDAARIIGECGAGRTLAYDDTEGMLRYMREIHAGGASVSSADDAVAAYSRKALTERLAAVIRGLMP